LGNKRKLVAHIQELAGAQSRRVLDLFTGSGVVARALAANATHG